MAGSGNPARRQLIKLKLFRAPYLDAIRNLLEQPVNAWRPARFHQSSCPTCRLPVNLISSWPRVGRSPQTKGIIAGFILQQIFVIEGAILLRPDERARNRCPGDREPNFAIEFASEFCNTRWSDSIEFLARRKTYRLCNEATGDTRGDNDL